MTEFDAHQMACIDGKYPLAIRAAVRSMIMQFVARTFRDDGPFSGFPQESQESVKGHYEDLAEAICPDSEFGDFAEHAMDQVRKWTLNEH